MGQDPRLNEFLRKAPPEVVSAIAQGRFEASLGHYDEAASCYERAEHLFHPEEPHINGMLCLLLANCYLDLLAFDGGDPDQLRHGVFFSVQSAAAYLQGLPEQAQVSAMINHLSQFDWWRDLEETGGA